MMKHPDRFYTYITTNQHRTVLYTGITNNLERRQGEHQQDAVYNGHHFAGRMQAFYVIWYEVFRDAASAIAREKQIKGWKRSRKITLIEELNPAWRFLNDELI